jgi:hypothetical protein
VRKRNLGNNIWGKWGGDKIIMGIMNFNLRKTQVRKKGEVWVELVLNIHKPLSHTLTLIIFFFFPLTL